MGAWTIRPTTTCSWRRCGFFEPTACPTYGSTATNGEFWLAHEGRTEPWLVGRPRPSRNEAPIAALAHGELRRIAQVFPDADSNVVIVCRDAAGTHTAVVDSRSSDEDLTRTRWERKKAGDLADLYWEIGCAFQVPTYWYADELGPFFPLPKPKIGGYET
jgi:hypothetical protein